MSTRGHHGSNSPDRKALYDEFLEKLPKDDEKPFPFSIKDLPLSRTASSDSASMDHSNRGEPEEEESSQPTPSEMKEFLKKIYEPVDGSEVKGFDYDKMSLKMMLLNEGSQDSLKLVGVVGMLGVGKTTLCRLIFDDEEVKQRFVPRILISMSEAKSIWVSTRTTPDEELKLKETDVESPRTMESVVERMLEHLGVEEEIIKSIPDDHKLLGLLYALHLQLKGKRYLIVIEDAPDKKDDDVEYQQLKSCLHDGHGFPKGYGGAVIVSSRNEEAIKNIVGEQNLHRLLPLTDPDSFWPIYHNLVSVEDKAEGPGSSAPKEVKETPKEVKEELLKKCGGLPLAARIMVELKRREMKQTYGSNEASTASKAGPNEASTASKEGSNEASTASKEGSNEASTASKAGPNEASTASKEGPNEASTASKEGPNEASTAPGGSDLQPATNNQNQI